jgi:hypothetical protein
MRRIVAVAVTVLILVVVPATTASAALPSQPVCGPNGYLEVSRNLTLHADLSCTLDVEAAAGRTVTVNLAGHTLTGNATGDSDVFGSGTARFENGTVAGTVRLADGLTDLSRVHVTGQVTGFTGSAGYAAIRNSEVDGLVLDTSSLVVDHDVLRGGVNAIDGVSGVGITATHNTIIDSPGAGISIGADFQLPDAGGMIADNTIVGSAGDGIEVDDLNSMATLTITRNQLIDNGGDGLSITSTEPPSTDPFTVTDVTVSRNWAIGNGGHGIIVVTGLAQPGAFVDGGHDRASGNALDPQCVGLVCSIP